MGKKPFDVGRLLAPSMQTRKPAAGLYRQKAQAQSASAPRLRAAQLVSLGKQRTGRVEEGRKMGSSRETSRKEKRESRTRAGGRQEGGEREVGDTVRIFSNASADIILAKESLTTKTIRSSRTEVKRGDQTSGRADQIVCQHQHLQLEQMEQGREQGAE
eukprot:420273-Hanusia_phi.AAC.1